MDMMSYFSCS